jgi:hypothetical protein
VYQKTNIGEIYVFPVSSIKIEGQMIPKKEKINNSFRFESKD